MSNSSSSSSSPFSFFFQPHAPLTAPPDSPQPIPPSQAPPPAHASPPLRTNSSLRPELLPDPRTSALAPPWSPGPASSAPPLPHKPLLIITPATSSHVQVSVLYNRRNDLRIRTCSGGHDYEGLSYTSISTEPFILIDLSILRDVIVDAGSNTAWASAGAILGELYYHIAKATLSYGFPGGTCSTVGLGGYLSGGGMGTMMRKYGISADNIIDAVLADADGNILDMDTMGEDMFCAIRGGVAASFGIILFYKVELVPVSSSPARTSIQPRTSFQPRTSSLEFCPELLPSTYSSAPPTFPDRPPILF